MFVCSSGGHLTQLYRLKPWWEQHDRRWVTFDTADATSLLAGETVAWAHYPTTRNIPNALRNLRLAWRLLRSERPDVVVSDGAGVAVPFFVIAKVAGLGHRLPRGVRPDRSRTLTGRLCAPFTDLFCVQWPEQQALYPGSRLIGRLL